MCGGKWLHELEFRLLNTNPLESQLQKRYGCAYVPNLQTSAKDEIKVPFSRILKLIWRSLGCQFLDKTVQILLILRYLRSPRRNSFPQLGYEFQNS